MDILIKLKSESEKELAELQHRIDCLSDKIAHCQNVIDEDGESCIILYIWNIMVIKEKKHLTFQLNKW